MSDDKQAAPVAPAELQAPPATTPEELRQATIGGINRFLNAGPVIHNVIGAEGLRMLAGQRAFWIRANLGDVQDYFTEYQKQS